MRLRLGSQDLHSPRLRAHHERQPTHRRSFHNRQPGARPAGPGQHGQGLQGDRHPGHHGEAVLPFASNLIGRSRHSHYWVPDCRLVTFRLEQQGYLHPYRKEHAAQSHNQMLLEDRTLHKVFSVLFLLFLFERGYFQAKAMRVSGELRKIKESKRKMATVILLFLVGQLWVIGSLIYLIRPTIMEWTCFSIPSWIRWFGAIITVSGMALEFSTQLYLGKNYSTTLHINEGQSLVTRGPYRYVRHPMYTALITVGIGLGLLSTSWYFLVPFIATGIVIAFRTRREEEALIERFGDEYIQYAQVTGRFFPLISRKQRRDTRSGMKKE